MTPGGARRQLRRTTAASVCAVALHATAALPMPQAPTEGLFLSLARDGHVVLAAGGQGHILRSGDDGDHWSIIPSPTQATLTRVVVTRPGLAYAVGFDATILRSDDTGRHWIRVQHDDSGDNPLFGIAAAANGTLLAVGGFGRTYRSSDGTDWQRTLLLGTPDGAHFNSLLNVGPDAFLLAGEQGLLMLGTEGGTSWRPLAAVVTGSLFGAAAVSATTYVAFGLRGHITVTQDGGAHWRAVPSGTSAELLGGAVVRNGEMLLVGSRGTALLLDRNQTAVRLMPQPTRASFADCLQTARGTVLTAGENGIGMIALPPDAAR